MDVVAEVVEDILEHHGVKGQKWGVRRAERRAARADKKFEKTASKPGGLSSTQIDIHNVAAERANMHDIGRINSKPEYVRASARGDFRDPTKPITRKYEQEHQEAYLKQVRKAAAEAGTNASGTREYKIVPDRSFLGWSLAVTDVKHADNTVIRIKVIKDSMGRIKRLEVVDDTMTQSLNFVDDMLEHYGVKGMQWGRRKDSGPQAVVVTDKKRRIKAKGGGGHPAHPDAVRARTLGQVARRSGHKALSDQELQEYAKRLNLEQNVKRLEMSNKSSAQQFVSGLLGSSGGKGGGGAGGGSIESAAGSMAAKQVANVLAKK